ncbi:MAG: transglycosylase SLT domain-containing protein [Casimicrobiaceae bacterium]
MATSSHPEYSQFTARGSRRQGPLGLALILVTAASVVAAVGHRVYAERQAMAAVLGTGLSARPSAPGAARPEHSLQLQTTARVEQQNIETVSRTAARKYRISSYAMREYVGAAYVEARRNRLDPLLIVAVMAVESRFNPIAQSNVGATGLMQVIPHYHADKYSPTRGESVLDPRVNIKVGARALKEYIARGGTETAGLQLYNGSSRDTRNVYAKRVIAERNRLRDSIRRVSVSAGSGV